MPYAIPVQVVCLYFVEVDLEICLASHPPALPTAHFVELLKYSLGFTLDRIGPT